MGASNEAADALAASGTVLYVGGAFGTAGGAPAGNIAKWNGVTWSTLGSSLFDHTTESSKLTLCFNSSTSGA